MEAYEERTGKINTRIINEKTRNIYKTFISNLYKKYQKKELNKNNPIFKLLDNKEIDENEDKEIEETFKFLLDDFDEILKTNTNGTIKYLVHIFSRTKFDMMICRYLPYVIFYNKEYQEKRAKIKKEILIDFDNEKEILQRLKDANSLNYEELILSMLLLFNPPKRVHEYQYCKIINKEPTNDDDKNYNYLYGDTIYINRCKNDKRTNQQKANGDFKNVNKLNMEYINDFLNRDNEYLLGKFIPDNKISIVMKNAFRKIFGFEIGIHELRRMFLTYEDEKGMNRTRREYLSIFLNHNLEEQNRYIYRD
jgi:hypothetical protein